MINLFSRIDSGSKFIGSYLGEPEFPIKTYDARKLIDDIDKLTFDGRTDTLFDYLSRVAESLLKYGVYGDEMIFVEHNKELDYGNRNS